MIITSKKAEKRPFSLAYEIDMLKKILLLPITNIVFDERYEYGKLYLDADNDLLVIQGQLYINNELIGNIPYYATDYGYGYNGNKQDELPWDKIYLQFKDELFAQVLTQQPLAATAETGKYKFLNIKDKNGVLINLAFCNYVNNEWTVNVMPTDVQMHRVEVKFELKPPLPL
jgi:hypothetical protein